MAFGALCYSFFIFELLGLGAHIFTCFYLQGSLSFCLDIYELGTYNSNYAPRERSFYKMFMLLDEEANPVTHKDHPTQ